MKNIHILPTDKPSQLYNYNDTPNILFLDLLREREPVSVVQHHNIYITNSEEIKEGTIVKIPCGVGKVKELHWKYGNDNPSYIIEDLFVYKLRYGQKEGELQTNSFRHEDVKKIILTTDVDLIKDGVQSIDDEFLEWFVKNPSCEFVEVEREKSIGYTEDRARVFYGKLKIIIPKEDWLLNNPQCKQIESCSKSLSKKCICPKEEPKQETLGDFIKRESKSGNESVGMVKGAKWQQEQDKNKYSEEDMRASYNAENEGWVNFDFWFEQFKNK